MDQKTHWENIYQTKSSMQVSWYADHLQTSLRLIEQSGLNRSAHIIDIGSGASTLMDDLMDRGFANLTCLDISASALDIAKKRLGARADKISWVEADITQASLPKHFDLWHDRAVFHFLISPEDRQKYVDIVKRSLKPHGYVLMATFALDGPKKCSGLDIVQYSPQTLHNEFGPEFQMVETLSESHHTPSGSVQHFIYCLMQYIPQEKT
ncbi:MAG: class I SAM-dependent methyltransferase [Pseudomonadota bacterium]|nr:class I SAM-dependent methyltransferase [Pseudomonadota bacterium]